MSLYADIDLPGEPDLENIRRLDLLAIPMIRDMQRVGFAIDVPYLQDLSLELGREMIDLEKDIASYIPPAKLHAFSSRAAEIEDEQGSSTFNANSADQIRTLLYEMLDLGRSKDIKLTNSGKKSTGKKETSKIRDEHPVVPLVEAYRERSKLKSAFADTLPGRAKLHRKSNACDICGLSHADDTYRIHTEFTTTRAETGRLSSKKPNLQQIPVRSELGSRIRSAFIASPGKKLVSVDFAQIELRDLAHCANARSMIEVYSAGGDLHNHTAMQCFGITDASKVDSTRHRIPAKTVNFAIVYGISYRALASQLAQTFGFLKTQKNKKTGEPLLSEEQYQSLLRQWTEEECERFISRWFDLYPEVRHYMDLQSYRASRYGFVWDVFGRIRLVPETRSCHAWIRGAGLRQAGNMPIQSASAGQTKLVMGELNEDLAHFRSMGCEVWPLLSMHDQIIVEADEEWADTILEFMIDRFRHVMDDRQTGHSHWRLPVDGDGEVMDRWKKG